MLKANLKEPHQANQNRRVGEGGAVENGWQVKLSIFRQHLPIEDKGDARHLLRSQ